MEKCQILNLTHVPELVSAIPDRNKAAKKAHRDDNINL